MALLPRLHDLRPGSTLESDQHAFAKAKAFLKTLRLSGFPMFRTLSCSPIMEIVLLLRKSDSLVPYPAYRRSCSFLFSFASQHACVYHTAQFPRRKTNKEILACTCIA